MDSARTEEQDDWIEDAVAADPSRARRRARAPARRADDRARLPLEHVPDRGARSWAYDDIRYIRLNNTPNQIQLGKKLADLEGAEAGLVTASGMAAITATLLTVLGRGGHLLAQNSLYGGTHSFITQDFPSLGPEPHVHRRDARRRAGRPRCVRRRRRSTSRR